MACSWEGPLTAVGVAPAQALLTNGPNTYRQLLKAFHVFYFRVVQRAIQSLTAIDAHESVHRPPFAHVHKHTPAQKLAGRDREAPIMSS